MFNPEALEKLVSVTEKWWTNGPSADEGIMLGLSRIDGNVCHFLLSFMLLNACQPTLLVLFFYNGSEVDARAKYKAFFDLSRFARVVAKLTLIEPT